MKQFKSYIFSVIAVSCLVNSSLLHAAQAKFNIIPVAGATTTFLLPTNFTKSVSYQVTNQTKILRTLTMVPITGVSQTVTGPGVCGNTFTLSPQQFCTLNLVINGSQVPTSGISGGPVVCKTKSANDPSPDPMLCSQPSTANMLAVSVTSTGQHAYIANQIGNSISFCQADPVTGFLDNCAITATGLGGPEGIGFNPAKTFFYISNPLTSSISFCNVNQSTGALSACADSGGTNFNLPDAVAFSPDGSVFYTSNFGDNTVTACSVNAITGALSACVSNASATFSLPGDMAINASGTFAYVVNRAANTTSVCAVSGTTVNNCLPDSGSGLFNAPEGITLSPSGLYAYIANAGNNTVVVCNILQDGTGLLANCAVTSGVFTGTGNVGLNNLGSFAYVPNLITSEVSVCNADLGTGLLSSCTRSRGTGFSGPAGIVLN